MFGDGAFPLCACRESHVELNWLVVGAKVWAVGRLRISYKFPKVGRHKYVINLVLYLGWADVGCDMFLLLSVVRIRDDIVLSARPALQPFTPGVANV